MKELTMQRIANGISNAVYQLSQRSSVFGTGFDLEIEGDVVKLLLMDGCAQTGAVIRTIEASSVLKDDGFLFEIVNTLESELFAIEG